VGCTFNSQCSSFGGLCVDGSCVISANNAENSFHVVTGNGTEASAALDGFMVTAGNASADLGANESGAGMYNDTGSPTVTNCTFSGNRARVGSGMYNVDNSSPAVTNCVFSANWASDGGGMFNIISSPIVTNCTFSGNRAHTGGGMANYVGIVIVTNSTFTGNSAEFGGGMYNDYGSPTVTNCKFSRNSARTGGGMFNLGTPIVTNCTFSGNSARFGGSPSFGGGMYNYGGSLTVTNCTFSANSAGSSGGGMYNRFASPRVTNGIFWGNVPDQMIADTSNPVVNYSIVEGGWSGAGGVGVLDADPLLVDADGPDDVPGTEDDHLELMPGSPAIDAADTTALPSDSFDLDGDGNTIERLSLDLGGNPRVLDDPLRADTGVPGSIVVDMGAYEFAADCNANGLADECDLHCLAAKGTCNVPGCGQSPDCNTNGIPDECDLASGSSPDRNNNQVPDECEGACCDLLSGGCEEDVRASACSRTHQVWTEGAGCVDAACEAVTGACCDHDPFGACTDGVTLAGCDCSTCDWVKLGSCSELDCPHTAIPTVGEWGLVVLALLLLAGAKLAFRRPGAPAR